jgi:hypothetical protein
MPKHFLVMLLAVVIGGCVAGAATSGRVVLKDDNVAVDVRFSNRDRDLIQDYYKSKKGTPPGLAKRGGNLPPGLAKRDKLPPGLSGEALPRELDGKLSPLPSGNYVRVRIGQDIVLMDGKTRVVFDVMYGVGD